MRWAGAGGLLLAHHHRSTQCLILKLEVAFAGSSQPELPSFFSQRVDGRDAVIMRLF